MKNNIARDNRARLHKKPHHISAMHRGMMVCFMILRVAGKNKIFMMASIHRN